MEEVWLLLLKLVLLINFLHQLSFFFGVNNANNFLPLHVDIDFGFSEWYKKNLQGFGYSKTSFDPSNVHERCGTCVMKIDVIDSVLQQLFE